MKTAIVIFVKTPGLSPVKTRLAVTVGKKRAEEIFLKSVQAVEAEVLKTGYDGFYAIAEHDGLSSPLWKNLKRLQSGEGDLGHRLHHVYRTLRKNYEQVVFIGADSPQLTADHINCAVQENERSGTFVFYPTHDGGFCLFVGSGDISQKQWISVRWSTENTLKDLTDNLTSCTVLESYSDIDWAHDLDIVLSQMPDSPSPEQRALVELINKAKIEQDISH